MSGMVEGDSTDSEKVSTVRVSSRLGLVVMLVVLAGGVMGFPFRVKNSAVVAYIEDFLGRKFGEVCCFRREETLEMREDFLVVMV